MSEEQHDPYEGAEYAITASLLEFNELISAVEVEKEHFPTATTRMMFDVATTLVRELSSCDLATFATTCRTHSPGTRWDNEFDRLAGHTPSRAMFPGYQQALKRHFAASRARAIGKDLIKSGDAETALEALKAIALTDTRHGYDVQALTTLFLHELENPTPAIPTGLKKLDGVIGGLHNSDLVVLGARPAMGKTALACNLALNAGAPFLFFSGEQPAGQLMQRMVSIMGGPPVWKIRNRSVRDEDMQKVADAVRMMKEVNPYVVDKPSPSLQDIVTESRKQHQERGIKLILVDYLQRMRVDGAKKRHEAIAEAVRGLKELARELDVPVFLLAQVNREVDGRAGDKHPTMADLLESGAIEAEADQILLMSRPHVYDDSEDPKLTVLSISKNRSGDTGKVLINFEGEYLRFTDRGQPQDDYADQFARHG